MTAGHFSAASPLRAVVGHRLTGLSGPRALLLMAAHPVAFQGFFAHTGALRDPYARLMRTAQVMDAVAFGTRSEADRLTRRVRAMHRRVRGELTEPAGRFPAGTTYRADDPELLLWILAALADSAMLVYSKYVRRIDAGERAALWRDYRTVGVQFGLAEADMPATIGAFDDYMDDMIAGGDLHVTAPARELAIDIVLRPPVPVHLRPLLELVNQITVGLLPRGGPPHVRLLVGSAPLDRAPRRGRVRQAGARPGAARAGRADRAGAGGLALALGEPAFEERALRVVLGQRERRAVGGGGLLAASEPAQHVGARRGQVAVAGQARVAARARRARPDPPRARRPSRPRSRG